MKNIFYAVYNADDQIITTCESYDELAKYFGRKNSVSLRAAVSQKRRILANNSWYFVYKIDERKCNNEI